MASVLDLAGCADRHVAHYVDPAGRRAFAAYDRVGNAAVLEPVDLLAPALLDAPVLGSEVIAMYRADGLRPITAASSTTPEPGWRWPGPIAWPTSRA